MCQQSPAKLLRSVKRITHFLEKKKELSVQPFLCSVILPPINILPASPLSKLTIVNVQTTNILPQTPPKPNLTKFKASSVNIKPEESLSQTPLTFEDFRKIMEKSNKNRESAMKQEREDFAREREKDLLEYRRQLGLPP